ncbi:putative amidase, partial [Saccharata proteae CBS 121410]
EDVNHLAGRAGISIPEAHVEDFRLLLGGFDSIVESILSADDGVTPVDTDRYPRTDIHVPDDTDKGGWATKVTARCTQPNSNLLHGRTVALKDNIAFAGVRCTNGINAANWTPKIDATVATRIMDAGATITGKSACENSCLEGVSETSCTGLVHNPYADCYSCGGSSSGSGRLVATGSVDMAIGCDQGGQVHQIRYRMILTPYSSIRIPSSCCGIVGLKATWGLIPYTGILSLDATIDHAGPMTTSVRDAALLLEAIAGPDGIDDRQPFSMKKEELNFVSKLDEFLESSPASELLRGMKVGVLEEGFSGLNVKVDDVARQAIEKLRALGAEVEACSVSSHKEASVLLMCGPLIAGARQALLSDQTGRKQLYLTDRFPEKWGKMSQATFDASGPGAQNLYLRHLLVDQKYGPLLNAKCANRLRKCTAEYDEVLARFDVLVMPTLPTPPSKLIPRDSPEGPLQRLSRTAGLIMNTAPFNATGHPALTIPCGFSPADDDETIKLPVGLQIVGRRFADLDCLKVGAAWEKAHNWKEV